MNNNQLPLPGIDESAHTQAFLLMRDKVFAAEDRMRKMPQVEIPVKHYFSYGVYAREIFIPKGVMLTGEIHKYSNLNIISKGDISVLVDDDIQRIVAPYTIISPAGIKRIAYANEDTVWTTIHGTFETNIAKIEACFIAKSEAEYLSFCEQLKQIGPS